MLVVRTPNIESNRIESRAGTARGVWQIADFGGQRHRVANARSQTLRSKQLAAQLFATLALAIEARALAHDGAR